MPSDADAWEVFELELDVEHGEPTVVGGRVGDEDVYPDLQRLFGQMVAAGVELRESRLPSGETKETHTLKSLSD